jgi:predicted NACHT family NTPase
MVEPVFVRKSDTNVYSIDVVEYLVPKDKKKYEDREEMINWCRCQNKGMIYAYNR